MLTTKRNEVSAFQQDVTDLNIIFLLSKGYCLFKLNLGISRNIGKGSKCNASKSANLKFKN